MGLGLTRLTYNWASKNLKVVFESTTFFIMQKLSHAFVNLICSLPPGSKYNGTLHRSLCNRPKSWNSLLEQSLSQRVMNPRFIAAVTVSAVVSQGCMRPFREMRDCRIGTVGLKSR